MGRPRILAPAGDVSAFKAALLAGADEVYVGLPRFNARMNAANIAERDLPELLLLAHRRRASVFLTTNVLLAQREIPELLDLAAGALEAGVDGLIVQDYGALRALRRAFPQAELHASTQMTTHNCGQVGFLARLGVRRVNLARELSIGQIEVITAHAHSLGVETEVFVHGAYCISFSGQCTMSSFMGGLSANRGLCFQPCRRAYVRSGARPRASAAGDLEFPLSLKDNNALAHAEALAAAGVDSLKIEGRMKGPHYVYNVVSAWRNRIDNGTRDGATGEADRRLGEVFNRGFSSGYLEGVISEEMRSDSPFDHSLVRIGTVERFSSDRMMLTVRPASFPRRAEVPTRLPAGAQIAIYSPTDRLRCRAEVLAAGAENPRIALGASTDLAIRILSKLEDRIRADDVVVWHRHALEADRIATAVAELRFEPVSMSVTVSGMPGAPLKGRFSVSQDAWAADALVESTTVLTRADRTPLTALDLERQFGRLGGTMFRLGLLDADGLAAGLFLPVSELNAMRRQAVDILARKLAPASLIAARGPNDPPPVAAGRLELSTPSATEGRAALAVLLSEPEDADALLGVLGESDMVLLEVADPARFTAERGFVPYFPTITMDDVLPAYAAVVERANHIVVNNSALIVRDQAAALCPWTAGPGFNLTNSEAFAAVSEAGGAAGGFLSAELNRDQARSVLSGRSLAPSVKVWVPVFGPLTLMTTMQCLAKGRCAKKSQDAECFTSCATSTDIRDEADNRFHILKRPWFRTAVYNALPLSLPQAVAELREMAHVFVVDLRRLPPLSLSPASRCELVKVFRSLLDHGGSPRTAEADIRRLVGETTRGNYRRGLARELNARKNGGPPPG